MSEGTHQMLGADTLSHHDNEGKGTEDITVQESIFSEVCCPRAWHWTSSADEAIVEDPREGLPETVLYITI